MNLAIERRIARLEQDLTPVMVGRWFGVIIDRTEDARQVAIHHCGTTEQRHGETDAAFEARYRLEIGMRQEDSIVIRRIIGCPRNALPVVTANGGMVIVPKKKADPLPA